MCLTESLAMMAGFGLPMVAAYAHGAEPEKRTGRPGLFISESHVGGDHFQVGDDVTFIIVVGNNSHASPITSTITVSDYVPAGIRNLRVSGHNWNIAMSDTKSPTVITAKYLGNDSVHGGEILPAIKISGKLTKDAIPHFTSLARVHTECACDTSNHKAIDTIFIEKEGHSQECNKCNEKKEHKRCQEREECQEKSGTATQGESPANNTVNPTPTSVPAVSPAVAVSSVVIASSNTYNIFGSMGSSPGFGGVGNAPASDETSNIPKLPDTGSNPNTGGL
jgi:uncharacterized repeat protein (TIGR01451 family)